MEVGGPGMTECVVISSSKTIRVGMTNRTKPPGYYRVGTGFSPR